RPKVSCCVSSSGAGHRAICRCMWLCTPRLLRDFFMRLWISLYLYRLGLDCWRLHDGGGPPSAAPVHGLVREPGITGTARRFLEQQLMQLPAAIFEHDRVCATTPAASRLGVRCGMRRGSAL